MRSAPEAERCAWTFGQPSRGLTSRRRASPKLAMTRAAAPIFSPSCGSTSTMIGPGVSIQFLVLSVPAPGMAALYLICAGDVPHDVDRALLDQARVVNRCEDGHGDGSRAPRKVID